MVGIGSLDRQYIQYLHVGVLVPLGGLGGE